MGKPPISPSSFLDECNHRLRMHADFEEGMAFESSPRGSSGRGMSGYAIVGPLGTWGVFSMIAASVHRDFDLVVE
jgi:hypothetical protein